jgi:hypothetical protein
MILKEGGNVFKDKKTGEELTQRINQSDVLPTVEWLEQLLLEKKKRKGNAHFPPEVEKIIKTKLKKQYKGNPGAIYGIATNIMKIMGLKKISKS